MTTPERDLDPRVYEMMGLALLGARESERGCREAGLAVQQLLFRLELEHPRAGAEWEAQGFPADAIPALAGFAAREIRPWVRQIDRSVSRADDWSRRLREVLIALAQADPDASAWARGALREAIGRAKPGEAETWRLALAEHRTPRGAPVRLLAAIGLLEGAFGCRVSTGAANSWEVVEKEGV